MTVPLFTLFCVFATATLALAARRLLIVRSKGDECLHLLDDDVPLIEKQESTAKKLQTVDVWGKTLTVLTIIAAMAAYAAWWIGE